MIKNRNTQQNTMHTQMQVGNESSSNDATGALQQHELRITVHDAFDDLQPAWLDIEENGDSLVFQSFHWLKNWYASVGRHVPVKLCMTLIESPQGRPVMLLPLGIEKRGVAQCLVWLGGALSDYHGPLLHKDFTKLIDFRGFSKLWDDVLACLPPFDGILFEKLPESIDRQKNPFLSLAIQPHPSDSHYMRLSGTLEALISAKRTGKSISTDRRKERRLGEHGQIGFIVANTQRDVDRLLPVMLRQKSTSYRELGVSDLFESAGNRQFIERMSAQFHDSLVLLCGLTVGDDILATFWGLNYKHRLYYLFPAYEHNELARYSPGNILLRYITGWCIESGLQILDFTVGDEPYKLSWRDGHMKLYDYYAYRSVRGWFQIGLTSLQRRIKRQVKHSPLLFKTYLAVRKRAAGLRQR